MGVVKKFVQSIHQKPMSKHYIAFARQQKGWQQSFALLPDVWKEVIGVHTDSYATPNSFVAPKRRIESLGLLNALFADIDDHVNKFRFASVLYFLQKDYFGSRVPWPNTVVETGRGMHLYWFIEPLTPDKLPLWQLAQNLILDALSDITDYFPSGNVEVDKKVKDATRLLRLPGTVNSATNTIVNLYEYSTERYNIEEIITEYFPSINYTKTLKKGQASKKPKKSSLTKLFNTYTLHNARLIDVAKLQELRRGFCRVGGKLVPTGQRELMCFLYRYYSCLFLQDEEEALRQTLEFNQGFVEPLTEKEVVSATRSAEKAFQEWQETGRGKYNYRNATLIELLGILPEEQRELKTIISTEEKYRRNNERRQKKRRDSMGMTKREREKAETVAKVKELKEQGLTQGEIAKKLGITQQYVSKIFKDIKKYN